MPPLRLRVRPCPSALPRTHTRCLSSSSPTQSATSPPPPTLIDARWLTLQRSRIGRCLTFGLQPDSPEMQKAGEVLRVLAVEWRDLLAGGEGYLMEKERRGLYRRKVEWGEMVIHIFFYIGFNGHVNNTEYNRYAESSRVEWAANYARYIDIPHAKQWNDLWTPRGDGMILKSIRTDFKFPMTYPDNITVYHRLTSPPVPTSPSIPLTCLILSEKHRRPAARISEDVVLYDYRVGRKLNLEARPFMLEAFRRTWEEQERTRRVMGARAEWVEKVVGEVERGSWDRVGAREL